jgi:hypothetical protein
MMEHSELYRRILHKMGFYDYQQGLIYRHLNQEGGWDTHLENCRSFILRAINYYKPLKVTVLGSGWLLELPLAEMLEVTNEITLVDIVHPPEVKQQVASFGKVKLSEQDVTGGLIEEVWNKTKKKIFFNKLRSPDTILIPEYQLPEDPGLVISLNILTQLEILPLKYLKERSVFTEEEFSRFRIGIQNKHINFLKKYKSVLITDTGEVFTENSGRIVRNNTLLTELPVGINKEEWTWNFDLLKSDYHNKRSVMEVIAIMI